MQLRGAEALVERELDEEMENIGGLIQSCCTVGVQSCCVLPRLPAQLIIQLATLVDDGARPGGAAIQRRPAIETVGAHGMIERGEARLAGENVFQQIMVIAHGRRAVKRLARDIISHGGAFPLARTSTRAHGPTVSPMVRLYRAGPVRRAPAACNMKTYYMPERFAKRGVGDAAKRCEGVGRDAAEALGAIRR